MTTFTKLWNPTINWKAKLVHRKGRLLKNVRINFKNWELCGMMSLFYKVLGQRFGHEVRDRTTAFLRDEESGRDLPAAIPVKQSTPLSMSFLSLRIVVQAPATNKLIARHLAALRFWVVMVTWWRWRSPTATTRCQHTENILFSNVIMRRSSWCEKLPNYTEQNRQYATTVQKRMIAGSGVTRGFSQGRQTLLKGAHWPPFGNAIISSQKFTYIRYTWASVLARSRQICGCKSSCTPGSWWIAHSTTR